MKKIFLFLILTAIMVFMFGCKEIPNTPEPVDTPASFQKAVEQLSPPNIEIKEGSGYIVTGTGLRTPPGTIDLSGIPNGATVKQVILYWSGGFDYNVRQNGDNKINVGGIEFTGNSIGGPTYFFDLLGGALNVYFETFRIDITDQFDWNGLTSLQVWGMDNGDLDPNSEPNENNGAGLFIIYDDGSPADIQLVDGQDLAYKYFGGAIKITEPQTFTFPASDKNRTANLGFLVASCGADRPSEVSVKLDGYEAGPFYDIFGSNDGGNFDSPQLTLNIPPDVTTLTVQLISDEHGGTPQNPKPVSLNWITAALSIDEDCGPCDGKITQLTLRNDGAAADIKVVQKKDNITVFEEFVGSGEEFTFIGQDKKGTLSTEISIYRDDNLDQKIHTSCSQDIFIGSVFGSYTVIDGYSRNGGKLCSTTNGGGGNGNCELMTEDYKIDKKKLEWKIKNLGEVTATIQSINVQWPEANDKLKKVEFDGKIYETQTPWNSAGFTITQFTGDLKDRQIKKNKEEKLKFEFTENAAAGPYLVTVVFEEGCELTLEIPGGGNGNCELMTKDYKTDKKKLEWKIKNLGEVTATIQSINVRWPEANDKLKKVEFDGKIYETQTPWNSAGFTITQFTGDLKDRQIKKNKEEKLKFEFTENAAAGPYLVTVVFEEGCELTLEIPDGGNGGGGTICDSKITQTLLKYIGPKLEGETIVRFVGKSGVETSFEFGVNGVPDGHVFDLGDGYTISALPGDLGSKMSIYINGVLNEVHHTSCSVDYVKDAPAPLDNPKGQPSSNWFVLDFLDKN